MFTVMIFGYIFFSIIFKKTLFKIEFCLLKEIFLVVYYGLTKLKLTLKYNGLVKLFSIASGWSPKKPR